MFKSGEMTDKFENLNHFAAFGDWTTVHQTPPPLKKVFVASDNHCMHTKFIYTYTQQCACVYTHPKLTMTNSHPQSEGVCMENYLYSLNFNTKTFLRMCFSHCRGRGRCRCRQTYHHSIVVVVFNWKWIENFLVTLFSERVCRKMEAEYVEWVNECSVA